ncbi:LOW QUALITY PROTEIN: hypothetical protein JCM19039_4574 [Geomicrobium sp. JCM 19039]|nr:LOW QUALITY PROTEIN: hypothetical protein JCM19039_4574 [Geomicrobium sp. JCM 19039]
MKVRIDGVHKSFRKDKHQQLEVLRDVSIQIKDGEFVSLLGPSGCGKSTILNLVAGLDSPSEGSITVDGKQVNGPGTDRVVVFQQGGLFPWMSVVDNVKYGLRLKKISAKEVDERADDVLKMVHLSKFKGHFPNELSGGMQQRVAIARALIMDLEILLMDEPFAALDEQTRIIMHQELQEIWQKTGKTILFITHNIREALTLSDRVLLMSTRPGQIKKTFTVQAGRPRDPSDSVLVHIEKQVMKELEEEMEKVLKEELGDDYRFKTSAFRDRNRDHMGDHI